jgi:hypothetical protein
MRTRLQAALLALIVAVGTPACTSGGVALTQPSSRSPSASPLATASPRAVSPTPTEPGTAGAGRPVPAALLTAYGEGGSFFAKVLHRDGTADIELDSTSTGLPLLSVLPSRRGRVSVVSVAAMGATRLMVTYGTGENCSNGLADCGPLPNVCGGEVDVLDLATGTMHPVWSFPRSVHVDGASPSPDGADVAARVAPCQDAYAGDHLQVRRLRDAKTWTIGAQVKGCRWLLPPSWVGTGHRLVVPYAAPTSASGCSPSDTWVVLGLNAEHSQPGFAGVVGSPVGHCEYSSVAARGSLVYAYAQCAENGQDSLDLEGPIRLVRLDAATLRPVTSWPLGTCGNGSALAVNHEGDVLLDRYHYCAHAVHGHFPTPQSVLQRLHAGVLSIVTTRDGGWLYYDELALA